jgi:protocatechuate 3,4-dioxygenase beta subunit
MYVEGRVLTTGGEPIPDAVIETWETDGTGEYHLKACVPSCPNNGWVVSFPPPLL